MIHDYKNLESWDIVVESGMFDTPIFWVIIIARNTYR